LPEFGVTQVRESELGVLEIRKRVGKDGFGRDRDHRTAKLTRRDQPAGATFPGRFSPGHLAACHAVKIRFQEDCRPGRTTCGACPTMHTETAEHPPPGVTC